MADVKWIKITTDIFDDDKILLIESLPEADSIIVIWFKLLCLAGKQNNSGVFIMGERIAYTDQMLATIFRRKETTVQLALQTFEQFGMIERVEGVITIPNWGKHQSLDQIESKKEYMQKYMREYREKQKLISKGEHPKRKTNSKTNSKTNVSSADKSREEKKRKENRLDIEVDVVVPDDENVLKKFDGIYLTDKQTAHLLDIMPLEVFDRYVAKVKDYPDANPYQLILKFYREDCALKN
jgi:predicted phage replisome organizer